MFRFLLRVGRALKRFLKSPSGKFVIKAVEKAIPVIKDVRGGDGTGRENAEAAKAVFDELLKDPGFPKQFIKQREAYLAVERMLLADGKIDRRDITPSNIMKIVELAHGSVKEGA